MPRFGLGSGYDTRNNRDEAPWQTYDRDMDPTRDWSDRTRMAVEAYSQRRHAKTSNQNLEELCRQQEMSREAVKDYKFDNQDEIIALVKERVGRIINVLDFWKKLETLVPCYISAHINRGLAGLAVLKNGEWKYVCGIQVGYMHEYSEFWIDSHGLPLNEKWRGWRGTVLFRLITGGFISEQDAHRVFGEPSGPASRLYRERLYHYRNMGTAPNIVSSKYEVPSDDREATSPTDADESSTHGCSGESNERTERGPEGDSTS